MIERRTKVEIKKLKKTKKTGSILNLLESNYGSSDEDSGSGDESNRKRKKTSETRTVFGDLSKTGPVLVAHPKKKKFSILGGVYGSDDSDSEGEGEVKQNNVLEVGGEGGGIIHDAEPDYILIGSQTLPVIRETYQVSHDPLRSMRLLPPEPPGKPNPKVQGKIRDFLNKKKLMGMSFNESLLQQKEFHNPYILTKIAELYKIDQLGSNYPRDIYNPREIASEDKYDAIAHQQRLEEAKQAEEKKKRSQVEFVQPTTPHNLGGLGPTLPTATTAPIVDPQQTITEAQIAAAKSKAKAAVKAKAVAAAAAAKATVSVIGQDPKEKTPKNDEKKNEVTEDKSKETLKEKEKTPIESEEDSKSRKKKWDQLTGSKMKSETTSPLHSDNVTPDSTTKAVKGIDAETSSTPIGPPPGIARAGITPLASVPIVPLETIAPSFGMNLIPHSDYPGALGMPVLLPGPVPGVVLAGPPGIHFPLAPGMPMHGPLPMGLIRPPMPAMSPTLIGYLQKKKGGNLS